MRIHVKSHRRVALVAFWIVVVGAIALDWRYSAPHRRFTEPPPLALGNGPAADAGHCSLAPTH